MMIYTVVRVSNEPSEFGCHVYAKQTSNLNKIKEYAKEIKAKYPSDKVSVMTREGAKELQKRYSNWFKKYESIRWELCYQKALMKNF